MPEKPPHNIPGGDRKPEAGSVTYLDQTLWRQLAEAETDEDFCDSWLNLQVRMISGAVSGMVALGPADSGPFTPMAMWPKGTSKASSLAGVLESALKERKGIVIRGDSDASPASGEASHIHVAFPVRAGGSLYGAAALEITPRPQEQLQSVMRQLQWGVVWLENRVLRKGSRSDSQVKDRVVTALDLAAVTLQEERFHSAATSVVTLLATRLDCDRVSVGFLRGRHIRVRALSHSSQFKKQMNLIRGIGRAMDESVDQQTELVFPDIAEKKTLVLRAHIELARKHGDGAICTIPFLDRDGKGYGALTLERTEDHPFDKETVKLCDSAGALIGPILEEKRRNDRLLIFKMAESFRRQLGKVIGRGHVAAKLITASLVGLVVFFYYAQGDYRVTAKTTMEGAVQMAVVAPYSGFISKDYVRAGDTVESGQLMVSLDDRDLKLERVKWESEREQYLRQYREAMAEGNRASMKVLNEQVNQARAQLHLIDEQLSRAQLMAPFAGIVVSGDLSQSLGSPVERGDVLFEVAPLDAYRVKLQVDEREIRQIQVGQTGTLVLNSLPESRMPITIQKITPVSAASEGKNFFVVEAGLDEMSQRLRPGMDGYSKVDIDRRRLIWIWTHELLDWVRLWMWSWWP
ncbi:HlyD family efflux transporter periplasmic adaptor subunit [bacterium]|nr:MAG: HlyD family efflux transporter periplasmic adaptor subunit [bacterium]